VVETWSTVPAGHRPHQGRVATDDALRAHAALSVYARGAVLHYRHWGSPDSPPGTGAEFTDQIEPFLRDG
jgi:hypothetical protein